MTKNEKQICEFLRKPMGASFTVKPFRHRLFFAYHAMMGHFSFIDGIRLHAAIQIENGQHKQ